jgi:hypothetical protein
MYTGMLLSIAGWLWKSWWGKIKETFIVNKTIFLLECLKTK